MADLSAANSRALSIRLPDHLYKHLVIQAQLADRLSPAGRPIPLIAETGGQNAMIVDSSALAEQVVGDVIASAFRPGEDHYKWIDFPQPNYASTSADMVLRDGRQVGMSMFNGYSYNERCMLSLGVVDADVEVGDVLTLVWGEPDGGTKKTSTERHKQAEIRVRVSPTPYAREAREN